MHDDVHHEAWRDRVAPELLDAVRQGKIPEVLRWLEDGLPADWQDTEGCSLIFLAAYHRRWAVIDGLLAHGASVDLPDRRGWTPLFWAAFNGHADIVSFLIGRGANPDVRNEDGEWPLFWAVYGAHSSCPASPDRRCEAEPNRCGRTRRALARKKFGPTGHRCHLGGASRPAPKPCPAWDFGRGHLIRPLHPCSPAARGREQRTSRQDPGNRPGTDRIPGAVVPKISFLPQNVANRRDNPRLSRVVICIFIRVRSLTIVCTGVPCNTVRKNQGCRHGQKRDLQVRGGAGT